MHENKWTNTLNRVKIVRNVEKICEHLMFLINKRKENKQICIKANISKVSNLC
jgi:hypothetical protein